MIKKIIKKSIVVGAILLTHTFYLQSAVSCLCRDGTKQYRFLTTFKSGVTESPFAACVYACERHRGLAKVLEEK
jgi:hypothetical protein